MSTNDQPAPAQGDTPVSISQHIRAYLNGPACCNGEQCACMGVTRLQQMVQEEAGSGLSTLRQSVARLTSEPRMKSMVVFTVDFDSQKDLLRKLNVQKQSTLIVFKGKKEVGRSTGDTNPGRIEALLNKSI